MAVFKYYNIQLLPLNNRNQTEIGDSGYAQLFQELSARTDDAKRKQSLDAVSGILLNDSFFAPFKIEVKETFAQGRFIKFNHIEKVQNLYTGRDEFEGGRGSTSQRFEFLFTFDFRTHTLAIQDSKGLPSTNQLIKALYQSIGHVSDQIYPEHTLKIQEMTSAKSLEEVFDADYYKNVNIEVTFSNSEEFEDELIAEMESDFKSKNIHTISHKEKPEKNASMTGLSKISMKLLSLAARFGNADVRYSKDGKMQSYHMDQYPVKIEIKRRKDEAPDAFFARVSQTVPEAREQTKIGEKIRQRLRSGEAQRQQA